MPAARSAVQVAARDEAGARSFAGFLAPAPARQAWGSLVRARHRPRALAPPQNLERLQSALDRLNARRVDGEPLALATLDSVVNSVLELASDAGEIKVVLEPAGTRGYDDLRTAPPVNRSARASALRIGAGMRSRPAP